MLNYLCSDCKKIPWSLLVQSSKNNKPVGDFEVAKITKPHEELGSSTCEVCQLFAFLKSSDLGNASCALRAIGLYKLSTGREIPAYPLGPDTPILSIVSENGKLPFERKQLGHAIAFEPSPQGPSFPANQRFDHKNFNIELITKWMDDCVANHAQCKPGTRSLIHTLEVIDCKETKDKNPEKPILADLPKDGTYAALSYVWGNVDHEFPQVVKDSITVALQLNCGYLWVDRHVCEMNPI